MSALLLGTGGVNAQPVSEMVERSWLGAINESTLDDDSILTEYSAERAARGDDRARLGIGFSPRFGCSPIARLSLDTELFERLGATDGTLLSITIDDEPLVWPVLLDRTDTGWMLSYRGSEQERSTLRLQFDIGEFAVLEIDDELSLTFSLLGSRRSAAAVESLCLAHEAIPWEGS